MSSDTASGERESPETMFHPRFIRINGPKLPLPKPQPGAVKPQGNNSTGEAQPVMKGADREDPSESQHCATTCSGNERDPQGSTTGRSNSRRHVVNPNTAMGLFEGKRKKERFLNVPRIKR